MDLERLQPGLKGMVLAATTGPIDPKQTRAPERDMLDAWSAFGDDLVPKLKAISANGYDQRIFVRGDKSVDYGRVMEIMALISSSGFTHIGLVTDAKYQKREAN